ATWKDDDIITKLGRLELENVLESRNYIGVKTVRAEINLIKE
ncbi:3797_t:CDS:1, partial [Rhizophagus irregularis]